MKLDQTLEKIQLELNRFQTRLIEYQQRAKEDKYASHGCKESASLRRSALDLKAELTNLTQSTGY